MGNYGWHLPVQASSFAAEVDLGIWIIHGAMILIFVVWTVFFVYLLMRYRARPGHKADRSHVSLGASLAPDILILTFEILLVVFYAIPSWSHIKMNFPEESSSTRINVVAEQFNWNIHYPGVDGKFGKTDPTLVDFANPLGLDPADKAGHDDIVTVNEMRLPVDKPVLIKLSSKDVIHSFFIPSFRVKQDAVPGMVIPVWFEPTKEGRYEIACAQLCGVGHAIMLADVIVESQESFDAWVAESKPKAEEESGESDF